MTMATPSIVSPALMGKYNRWNATVVQQIAGGACSSWSVFDYITWSYWHLLQWQSVNGSTVYCSVVYLFFYMRIYCCSLEALILAFPFFFLFFGIHVLDEIVNVMPQTIHGYVVAQSNYERGEKRNFCTFDIHMYKFLYLN